MPTWLICVICALGGFVAAPFVLMAWFWIQTLRGKEPIRW